MELRFSPHLPIAVLALARGAQAGRNARGRRLHHPCTILLTMSAQNRLCLAWTQSRYMDRPSVAYAQRDHNARFANRERAYRIRYSSSRIRVSTKSNRCLAMMRKKIGVRCHAMHSCHRFSSALRSHRMCCNACCVQCDRRVARSIGATRHGITRAVAAEGMSRDAAARRPDVTTHGAMGGAQPLQNTTDPKRGEAKKGRGSGA